MMLPSCGRSVRPDHRRRVASLLLGQVPSRRKPDALTGGLWVGRGSPRSRRPRCGKFDCHLARCQLREPHLKHALDQSLQPLLQGRHQAPRYGSSRLGGGGHIPPQCRGVPVHCRRSWSSATSSLLAMSSPPTAPDRPAHIRSPIIVVCSESRNITPAPGTKAGSLPLQERRRVGRTPTSSSRSTDMASRHLVSGSVANEGARRGSTETTST